MERPGASFNPQTYSDVPLYNIQAVSAATGVPAITLRSWERRYGVPEPKRDPKGYRLYSERDIAVTRWLKERVQQGVGISRAVRMLRVLEAGEIGVEPQGAFDFQSLQDRMLGAVQRLDESGVSRIIGEALMVASVEDVSLGVIEPLLCRIGAAWEQGHLSVTAEHVASNLIRSHVAQLVRLSPAPLRRETVIAGGAPGELHDIGALMLTLFLRRRGFHVIFAGASIEPQSFMQDMERARPAAVCLSAATLDTARSLTSLYQDLQPSYAGVLAFGGRVFNQHPSLVERVPGLHLGQNAREASAGLERALA